MNYDVEIKDSVEEYLRNLVHGVKGVRKIRGCSTDEGGAYRISFLYQRKEPIKKYLLIFDPERDNLTICANGRIGNPPQNIQERLIDK